MTSKDVQIKVRAVVVNIVPELLSVLGISFVNKGYRRGKHTVGNAIPGNVVLGYIRKVAEHTLESKLVSSIPPWPLFWFLP